MGWLVLLGFLGLFFIFLITLYPRLSKDRRDAILFGFAGLGVVVGILAIPSIIDRFSQRETPIPTITNTLEGSTTSNQDIIEQAEDTETPKPPTAELAQTSTPTQLPTINPSPTSEPSPSLPPTPIIAPSRAPISTSTITPLPGVTEPPAPSTERPPGGNSGGDTSEPQEPTPTITLIPPETVPSTLIPPEGGFANPGNAFASPTLIPPETVVHILFTPEAVMSTLIPPEPVTPTLISP